MPVTIVKEDPRRGRGQNAGRSNRAAQVYAGGPKDHKNHYISPNNPWTAYQLPRGWRPKLMEDSASSNSDSRVEGYSPTKLSEDDQATAIERLERKCGKTTQDADSTPSGSGVRRAVVIDTEGSQSKLPNQPIGVNPLASLGVVDFLTGETLLGIAVLPEVPITKFMPGINGISAKWYHEKRRIGNIVQNPEEARGLLARYVGEDTVVVGHALSNEAKALGMRFKRSYDTQAYCGVRKGLKNNAPVPCQNGSHSAVEDALATRELALEQLGVAYVLRADGSLPPPSSPSLPSMESLAISDGDSAPSEPVTPPAIDEDWTPVFGKRSRPRHVIGGDNLDW